jgi:hypothetical protein
MPYNQMRRGNGLWNAAIIAALAALELSLYPKMENHHGEKV